MTGALAKGFPQPLTGGIIIGISTALTILVVGLVFGRVAWPIFEDAARIPWWAWLGGVLGGGIIACQLLIAQQVGAASFFGVIVTAGVVTSIALDHFGWIGFEQHSATFWRIAGGMLMIGGVTLVALS
ncbi:hypothetical protein MMMDOFMJ_3445 [Methylobacterium gnaphalii]|nr:hypothetical protein MMMDOFMJ_3445 [Methylobacterium gnaphalii]